MSSVQKAHQEAKQELEVDKKESLLDQIRRLRKENLESLDPKKLKKRMIRRKDLSAIQEEQKLDIHRFYEAFLIDDSSN